MFTCVPTCLLCVLTHNTLNYNMCVQLVYTSIIIRCITTCVNLFPTALIPVHIGNESIVTERDTIYDISINDLTHFCFLFNRLSLTCVQTIRHGSVQDSC